MSNKQYALEKVDQQWQFNGESSSLEEFIWDHLTEIFGFKPLRQQFFSKGEIGDILAMGKKQQLIVIELKNTEDR